VSDSTRAILVLIRAVFVHSQVGLAVALRHVSTGRTVVAVTTHLSCNFQEPWTQVAQIQTVLMGAAKLAEKHGPSTAVVLGGDLNSIPGSGVYHLVTSGHLPAAHPHLTIIAEHVEMPVFGENGEFGGGATDLKQPLRLSSAYGTILGQEPLFTNFTPGFVGTLDYIFGNDQLIATQVLRLPSEDAVRAEGFLPASTFPSDHLYLAAKFRFQGGASDDASRMPPPPQPHHSDGVESPTKRSRTVSSQLEPSSDWRNDANLPHTGTVSLAARPSLRDERLSNGSHSDGSGDSEGDSVHSGSERSSSSAGGSSWAQERHGDRYGHGERHGAPGARRRGGKGSGGKSRGRR
jgi:endonuclease/exonuclease/phosphatase family metal-dependent hydrolase